MDNLNPRSLADSLYKKHESLAEKCSKELKNRDRLVILEEKIDQLNHWITEHKSDANMDKYIKEKNNSEEELENLKKSVVYDSSSHKKRDSLKEKIKNNTNAMNYWKKVFDNNGTIS